MTLESSPVLQSVLFATLSFFCLSFVFLRFRRGISMQLSLLFSLIGGGVFCYAVGHWNYVFGLLIVYLPLWLYQVHRFTSLLAKDQLDCEWTLLLSDFEAVPIDPNDFPDLDHEYYDSTALKLEKHGFYKLRDVDFRHASRAFPNIRTFNRLFLHRDHKIAAVLAQQKIDITIIPFFYRFSADYRYVELSTEFSDGTFFITSNTQGIFEMDVEGIEFDFHPPETPLDELVESHGDGVDQICEDRDVAVRLSVSEADFYAAAAREHLVIRRDRLKKGGATVEMSRQFSQADAPDGGEFSKEYLKQAQKRAELEQRKQDEGDFI